MNGEWRWLHLSADVQIHRPRLNRDEDDAEYYSHIATKNLVPEQRNVSLFDPVKAHEARRITYWMILPLRINIATVFGVHKVHHHGFHRTDK